MSINVVEQIQSDLYNLVQTFDWSYMMSDSHQVWEVGNKVERDIKAKVHALCAIHKEDAEALYEYVKGIAGSDYTDYDANGYGLKYRSINNWFSTYVEHTTIYPN